MPMKVKYIHGLILILLTAFLQNLNACEIVKEIEVNGNTRIPESTIIYYSGIKKESIITRPQINRAIKILYKQGFFKKISVTLNKRGQVFINVKENPKVRNIEINGIEEKEISVIKQKLETKSGGFYSKFKLNHDVKKIESFYRAKEYPLASINYKIQTVNDDNIDIIITIKKRKKLKIDSITFYGNKIYKSKELKNFIASKEATWYRMFHSDHIYSTDRVLLDKNLLKAKYMQKGYIDFKVISSSKIDKKNGLLFLNFELDEGEQFHFGNTSINCELKKINKSILENLIQYKKNQVFSTNLIEKTINKINYFLNNTGFYSVNTTYDIYVDREKKIVNVNLIVSSNSKYSIRNINIHGNTRTLDRIIRRELKVYEGDTFDPIKIQQSERGLLNLGYFDSVKFQSDITDEKNKIDLTIQVKEASTGSMRFAASYNPVSGPVSSVALSEYNFLGKGQLINFGFDKAAKDSNLSLSFTEPRVLDTNLSSGFEIFSTSKSKSIQEPFNAKSKGLSLKLGYGLNEHSHHNIHYSIKSEKAIIDENASIFLMVQPKKTLSSILGHSFIYDKLNNRINPTNGYIIKLTQSYAGIGGDVYYIKSQVRTSYYKPIYKKILILNLVSRIGEIQGINGSNINIKASFFIGQDYIRGFDISGIGPRVKKYGGVMEDNPLGGKRFISGTAEVLIPLSFPRKLPVKGVIFTDFGTLHNTDAAKYKCSLNLKNTKVYKEISKNPICYNGNLNSEFIYDSKKIRMSYGLGIIWDSPFGIIKLDYGLPLRKESFDHVAKIRLSIGNNF